MLCRLIGADIHMRRFSFPDTRMFLIEEINPQVDLCDGIVGIDLQGMFQQRPGVLPIRDLLPRQIDTN